MSLFLLLSALASSPQAAVIRPSAAVSSDAEIGAAIKALTAVTYESSAVQTEIAPLMQRSVAAMKSPSDARATIAELRPLLARQATALRASSARLAALRPVTFPADVPYSFTQLQGENRRQNDGLLRLVEALDAMLGAAVAGDRAGIERGLGEVSAGAVTLISGQVTILRGRQIALPTRDSTHQSIGVAATLYESMAVVVGVMIGAPGEGASAPERLRLLAANGRALAAAGRTNVARELREMDQREAPGRDDIRAIFAMENETFDLGDRMACTLDEYAAVPLTAVRARALQERLVAFETAYQGITSRQVAAMP